MDDRSGVERFVSHMKKNDLSRRVLIIEPSFSHQEIIPSLIYYFDRQGFGADVLLRPGQNPGRNIEPYLATVAGPAANFFYAMEAVSLGYLARMINSSYPTVYFNTLFEPYIRDGFFSFCASIREPKILATAHNREWYEARRHLFPEVPRGNVFVLSPLIAEERGMPFLLPSVFFADKDECPARDGSLPGFLCVGSVDGSRRDYDQLIDAGILLTERGFSGRYRVSVACSSSETDYYRTFRDNLSRYSLEGDVVVYENLPFRDLFALARETPYQLFLLNKRSRWNLKYLAEKITGGINISFGFGIVPVLEDVFARRWGVEDLSLVYDGTEGLVGAIEAVVENPSLFIPNRDRIFAANERLVAESETSLASVL